MKCDKYIKKAKVGLFIFLSIFIIVIFKDVININSFFKILNVIYIFSAGFTGIAFVLPYIRCIVDYNQSHKPPHK
jgi:hypothetical protein